MKKLLLLSLLAAFVCTGLFAQPKKFNPKDQLPLDPKIKTGMLPNGLKYYVKTNKRPEKRAELRLVVKTGSVMEDDDQQGLAHFSEHMAFNGTKHFPKQDLVSFMESIGMRFGASVNAYTSFDETVYMLTVPIDSTDHFEKSFLVLEDWAANLSFDTTEVEKERGVVLEEWRLGQGAEERVANKQYPIIFYKSKYANRLPIGKREVFEAYPEKPSKRFYADWYRPNLMAVVAVGDFDEAQVVEKIKKHFGHLTNPAKPRTRTLEKLPDHTETLVSVESDSELAQSAITIFFKRAITPEKTVADYRKMIVSNLYDGMLNNRLQERLQKPNPPFSFAYAGDQQFVGDKRAYVLVAGVKSTEILQGLDALFSEAIRVQQNGFTQTELERSKKDLFKSIESAYLERNKEESRNLVAEYMRNFLRGEPVPGIEFEYELYKKVLPAITLKEVNATTKERLTLNNRVVTVSATKQKDVTIPTTEQVASIVDEVSRRKIGAYEDVVVKGPLMVFPAAGSVVKETKNEKLGLTEWTLSNGIQVTVKPTDFKNDEILFTAFSPGGVSLSSDANYYSAQSANIMVRNGGVSNFDQIALQKMLAGKKVGVSPYIGDTFEGFQGNASPRDLELMFQLIHVYAVAPRKDTSAFNAFITRIKTVLQNRKVEPEAAYRDTIQVTLNQYHMRALPVTPETFDLVNVDSAFVFLKDRFADLSDFKFFVVGSFSLDTMKMFVERYLANLPTIHREETWRDVGLRYPKGVITKSVYRGAEPKSNVEMDITGDFEWTTRNRFEFQATMEALQIKLREVVREEKSGTYGIGASVGLFHYPNSRYCITINFGCAPERVDELTNTVLQQIDSVRNFGIAETYVNKVKEIQKKDLERNLRENRFWLSAFSSYSQNNEDVNLVLERMSWIDSLTPAIIQKTVQTYLNMDNCVTVRLFPEKK
jgi:zinc protease